MRQVTSFCFFLFLIILTDMTIFFKEVASVMLRNAHKEKVVSRAPAPIFNMKSLLHRQLRSFLLHFNLQSLKLASLPEP